MFRLVSLTGALNPRYSPGKREQETDSVVFVSGSGKKVWTDHVAWVARGACDVACATLTWQRSSSAELVHH